MGGIRADQAVAQLATQFHRHLANDNIDPGIFVESLLATAPAAHHWECTDSYPFVAGVAPDGAPLETSISLGLNGATALRFLVQPAANTRRGDLEILEGLRQIGTRLDAQGDTMPLRALLRALIDLGVRRERSYFAWLGFEQCSDGATSQKLYINPWAIAHLSPGEVAGLTASLVPAARASLSEVGPSLGTLPPAALHIIGFNAPRSRPLQAKLYFVVRTRDPAEIDPFIAGAACPELMHGWQALRSAIPWQRAPRGLVELHLSICAYSHKRKINFFCPDIASDDRAVLALIKRWSCEMNAPRASLQGLTQLLACKASAQRINFLGLAHNKLDVYFRPW